MVRRTRSQWVVQVAQGVWCACLVASQAVASPAPSDLSAPSDASEAPTEVEPDRSPAGRALAEESRGITQFDWLDPEKQVYVVQNRRFPKAQSLNISLMGGLGLSNPYRTSGALDPRLTYFFKEWIGIEGFYGFQFHMPNATQAALEASSPNALPLVREITSYAGAMLVFAPIYAKLNLFSTMVYLDWTVSAGAGALLGRVDTRTAVGAPIAYVNQTYFSPMVATGQWFHLSKWAYLRWDLLAAFYSAPNLGTSGTQTWYTAFQWTAGVGLRW